MKLDAHIVVIACVMSLMMCEGIEVKEFENSEDISKKSTMEDAEAPDSRYVFHTKGNGFKRYDTISGRGSNSLEPFIKADGFGNSDFSEVSLNYGFNYPRRYNFANIDKGIFDVQTSLRHLDGQDSGPSNIGGFDYAESDGIHAKGSFAQHHSLPRRPGYHKFFKSKSDYGVSNIVPISNVERNNREKWIERAHVTDDSWIPILNYRTISPRIASGKSNYAFDNVSNYEDEEETKAGEMLSKGYKVTEDFDKDEREAIEKSHQSGYRKEVDGSKKGEEEENLNYTKNESTANGSSGENYGKNESHKKGQKTSGFHNVYHKDEYKKDTSFYDNEHVDGHEEKYDSENSQHEEAEGGQENVEKLDAGYHENEHAQKEVSLNEHQYGGAQGNDREASGKEYYAENAAFSESDEQRAAKTNSDSLYLTNH